MNTADAGVADRQVVTTRVFDAPREQMFRAFSDPKQLMLKAPLSLEIALAQVRRGPHWSFDDCMRAELRIVWRIVRGVDFYEGVRAVIIDKDNAPGWRPATLSEVTAAEVERHFAPLARELVLP